MRSQSAYLVGCLRLKSLFDCKKMPIVGVGVIMWIWNPLCFGFVPLSYLFSFLDKSQVTSQTKTLHSFFLSFELRETKEKNIERVFCLFQVGPRDSYATCDLLHCFLGLKRACHNEKRPTSNILSFFVFG